MEIINKKRVKLIQWLCGEDMILQHVQSEGLITRNEYIKVKSIQQPSDKITELLDLLMSKGDKVCVDFLELLKNDEVNESRPELKEWISTVNTSARAERTDDENNSQARDAPKIADNQGFLRRNQGELVDKVKNVDRIVDDLSLTDEMAANVRAEKTDQAKMRKVLDYSKNTKRAAKLLVDALNKHAADVMEDLATA